VQGERPGQFLITNNPWWWITGHICNWNRALAVLKKFLQLKERFQWERKCSIWNAMLAHTCLRFPIFFSISSLLQSQFKSTSQRPFLTTLCYTWQAPRTVFMWYCSWSICKRIQATRGEQPCVFVLLPSHVTCLAGKSDWEMSCNDGQDYLFLPFLKCTVILHLILWHFLVNKEPDVDTSTYGS
jgi:hypothetical protein